MNQTVIPTYSQSNAAVLAVKYTDGTTYMATDNGNAVSIIKPIYEFILNASC